MSGFDFAEATSILLRRIDGAFADADVRTMSGHHYAAAEPEINAALRRAHAAAREEALEEAAGIADNPYGDAAEVMGSEEPLAVGRKIAAALRRLKKGTP